MVRILYVVVKFIVNLERWKLSKRAIWMDCLNSFGMMMGREPSSGNMLVKGQKLYIWLTGS